MKQGILLFVFLLISVMAKAQIWELDSLNYPYEESTNCNYGSVASIDTNWFYIAHSTTSDVKSSCEIIRTSDMGVTWDTVFYSERDSLHPQLLVQDLIVADTNKMTMLYQFSKILYTEDAGITWDTVKIDNEKFVGTSNLKLWGDYLVAGNRNDSTIAYSADLGKSWTKIPVSFDYETEEEITEEMTGIPYFKGDDIILNKHYKTLSYRFADAEQEYTVQFLKSSDKGVTWTEIASIPYNEVLNYEIGNDGNIYTVSSDRIADDTVSYAGQKYIFSDRISFLLKIDPNTSKVDTLFTFDAKDIEQCQKLEIFDNKFVASFYNKIYVSDDYGSSFRLEKFSNDKEETNFEILSTSRPIFEKGMLIGNNIFGKINYPVSVEDSRYFVEKISLYPNPSTSAGTLNLEFDAKEAGVYSYKLSTIDGRAFTIGSESFLCAGVNNLELQLGSNLAPGAYFLSIMKDGEVVATEKVIVE